MAKVTRIDDVGLFMDTLESLNVKEICAIVFTEDDALMITTPNITVETANLALDKIKLRLLDSL